MGHGSSPTSCDDHGTEPDYGSDESSINTDKRDEYSKKAWDYHMDFKEEELSIIPIWHWIWTGPL